MALTEENKKRSHGNMLERLRAMMLPCFVRMPAEHGLCGASMGIKSIVLAGKLTTFYPKAKEVLIYLTTCEPCNIKIMPVRATIILRIPQW